jgi:hypothetical protein
MRIDTGTFKAEHWDGGDYVVTCSVGPIGQALNKQEAFRVASWLNGAIPELLRKLTEHPSQEEEP